MENGLLLEVEVAYALLERQFLKAIKLERGATVREAIVASGVLSEFPQIDLESVSVGIFSKRITLDTPLSDGDRVEIYRPLLVSPTEARRLRAQRKAKI
jgi:putative ubiquitin-RnfH superfamily antitoxin RatB of RatAB toxin-antitoxin module